MPPPWTSRISRPRSCFPDKPAKALLPDKPEWAMPQEEGADNGAPAAGKSAPAAEANSKEEISPLLAKAIGKERETKHPKDMAPLYQAVVEAEPENAAAHYRLGLAQARSGEFAKSLAGTGESRHAAARESEVSVRLRPGGPAQRPARQSLSCLQAAAAAAPSSGRYQNALGDCFLAAGRLDNAAEAYKRAINAAPDNAEYLHNLGWSIFTPAPSRKPWRFWTRPSACAPTIRGTIAAAAWQRWA